MANDAMSVAPAKRRIGILHSGADKADHNKHIDAFIKGLEEAGYDASGPNKNLDVKARLFAGDDSTKLADHAKTLITTHNVEVLVAAGGSAAAQAAQSIAKLQPNPTPIVFTSVSDPDAHDRNMTGICARTSELDGMRLRLLHELLPNQTNLGALVNPDRLNFPALESALNKQARDLGLSPLSYKKVTGGANPNAIDAAIDQAFKDWNGQSIKGAVVTADPLFNNHRDKVISAARKYKVAAIYQWSEFADAGGLMSYGTNLQQAYELAGNYVGRILDGDAPDKLPVTMLTKFELVINLGAASQLAIGIPRMLYARADRTIP